MSLSNVSNGKTYFDHSDLENILKIKLMTRNERSCNYESWVEVSSLYLKWLLVDGHLSILLVIIPLFLLKISIASALYLNRGQTDLFDIVWMEGERMMTSNSLIFMN